jgi:hypothetical protein
MARVNVPNAQIRTHEGGIAKHINPELQLRRSVMACFLWEDTFYEGGVSIAERISEGVGKVSPEFASSIAIEARNEMNLRHVPLLIVREMARLPLHRKLVAYTIYKICVRADDMTEFLAIYWKDGKEPLSAQVKKGLANAFTKFDEYRLAKYDRKNEVQLKDVLRLCHARPLTPEMAALWKRLIDGNMKTPDTWEVALSSGADKRMTWERLLTENKLGALALIRNLRNMKEAKVPVALIKSAIYLANWKLVLPYRLIAAAKAAPEFEPIIDDVITNIMTFPKLKGKTYLVVDRSGSMNDELSGRSTMTRFDAACGLAMIAREMFDELMVFSFADHLATVPARRTFALRDAIRDSQDWGWTNLWGSLRELEAKEGPCDRLIVITDEQVGNTGEHNYPTDKAYMINVGSYQNGVGYGNWTHIDGFSGATLKYIQELESADKR